MDTTVSNVSYELIPLQSQNEDQTASSTNTGGFFRTLNQNRSVAIGLGVAFIGGAALGALGMWAGLEGVKCECKDNKNLPVRNTTNTNGNSDLTGPGGTPALHTHSGRSITVSNAIHPATQQLIAASITTPPKFEVSATHSSWTSSVSTSNAYLGGSSTKPTSKPK